MTVETLVDDADGVRVLHASGELDVTVVPALLAGVPALLSGARGLVLDLTDVTFFDSSGVRLVDRLARESSRAGVGFLVAAPPGNPARRVLQVVGLAAALVEDDRDAAVVRVRP